MTRTEQIEFYSNVVIEAMNAFKCHYNPEGDLYIDNIDAHLDLLRTAYYIEKLLELTKPKYDSQSS